MNAHSRWNFVTFNRSRKSTSGSSTRSRHVGGYIADLVVEKELIVELKCVGRFGQ